MNRSKLDFLDDMFPFHDWQNLNLVIVNQSKTQELQSSFNNHCIINSTEFGLSKSRNLALKKCTTAIAIIADDDVVYKINFLDKIVNAYNKYTNAGLILFQIETFSGKPYKKNYPGADLKVSKRNRPPISSIEMTVKKSVLLQSNIFFNEYFGLGSYFQSGEEQLLFKELLKKNISVYHIPEFIVEHDEISSATNQGDDRFVYAQAALKYLEYKNLSFLLVIKFIFFLVRYRFISIDESLAKFKVGVRGIKKIKQLLKDENISKTRIN